MNPFHNTFNATLGVLRAEQYLNARRTPETEASKNPYTL